ncbi:MAG: ammonium transporter, partial [Gammaproteobacteria bacterium]|nr:ammonium transporter [Gammaproteobacteria bacterium]
MRRFAMKNLTGILFAMLLVAVPMLASAESAPAAPAAVAAAEAPVAPAAAAAPAPVAPKPVLNTGDTAWMLTSMALVLLMTIPGLALFYAGMVRSKNVLSVMMQCFAVTALVSVLWALFNYSFAFSTGGMTKDVVNLHSFIGDTSKVFLKGVDVDALWQPDVTVANAIP